MEGSNCQSQLFGQNNLNADNTSGGFFFVVTPPLYYVYMISLVTGVRKRRKSVIFGREGEDEWLYGL